MGRVLRLRPDPFPAIAAIRWRTTRASSRTRRAIPRSAWPWSKRFSCSDSRSRSGPRGSTTCPRRAKRWSFRSPAEQFAWNVHYAGPDGVFGRTDIKLLDLQSNPLGLDRDRSRREGRRHDPQSALSAGEQADHHQAQEQGRHPQLRRARVPREAGRHPRPHHPHLVRPQRHDRGDADPDGESRVPVRDCLRAALRPGPLPDAGIRHRPDRRGVPEVDGGRSDEQSSTGR